MAKYIKKPVVVDAEKVSELLHDAEKNWDKLPDWIKENYEEGNILFGDNYVVVNTSEGIMRGDYDDFLIRGVKGEIYPCKPDVFELTYQKSDV